MQDDVLYHGTTRDYHRRALKNGSYRPLNLAESVRLSNDVSSAYGEAVSRGDGFEGLSILVIRRDMIPGLRNGAGFCCDSLPQESYILVDLEVENYILTNNTKHRLEAAKEEVLKRSYAFSL